MNDEELYDTVERLTAARGIAAVILALTIAAERRAAELMRTVTGRQQARPWCQAVKILDKAEQLILV